MIIKLSLLDFAAAEMGCAYLSDLRFLSDRQRHYLAYKLQKLTPRKEDLHDWNDALEYLTGESPERTAHAAKARLVNRLLISGIRGI